MVERWSYAANDVVDVDEHDDDFTCCQCGEEITFGYEIEDDDGDLFCIGCYEKVHGD